MTMEQNPLNQNNTKSKQKKSISKLLLPKVPNKVGVLNRSQSTDNKKPTKPSLEKLRTDSDSSPQGSPDISRRPLNLDLATLAPKKEEIPQFLFSSTTEDLFQYSPKIERHSGQLRRCSSADDNISRLQTPTFDESKLCDRCMSHETVLKDDTNSSMNSLATTGLMPAQVLHLIPTIKARQRNFLHGRIGANSLLGPGELDRNLPNRQIHIFVGSWNMNGQTPPKELNDFVLPIGMEHVPDILAFGTQESCSERFEW
ncbi:hypothetical protein AMK59_4913, partial [Oryctes borbonicus]